MSSSMGDGTCQGDPSLCLGHRTLDIERLCQIADRLEVPVAWLVGRSNVMNVFEAPESPEPTPAKEVKVAKPLRAASASTRSKMISANSISSSWGNNPSAERDFLHKRKGVTSRS
jgi:hypothetical protein